MRKAPSGDNKIDGFLQLTASTHLQFCQKKFMKLPDGHQTVMVYLIIPRANEFVEFAKRIFGATQTLLHLNDDQTVMHGEIMIGGTTIMFGNSSEQWKARPASLYVYSEDVDRDYKQALKLGATSLQEPEDKHYGRACGIEDPFGNAWWITSL
jgi:PhnB protein